jgi:hypothetical protein
MTLNLPRPYRMSSLTLYSILVGKLGKLEKHALLSKHGHGHNTCVLMYLSAARVETVVPVVQVCYAFEWSRRLAEKDGLNVDSQAMKT